jgi:hypothetical protein
MGTQMIVMPDKSNPNSLQRFIPDLETPLVCVGPGWGAAEGLATDLHNAGYQYVFTRLGEQSKKPAPNPAEH